MARTSTLLLIASLSAFTLNAQHNMNNVNVQTNMNNPPPVQQHNGNVSDWVINDDVQTNGEDNFKPFKGNVFQTKPDNLNKQDNDPPKKEPCTDCDEIKKLKQLHYSPSYTPGSAKKYPFRKLRNKTAKKMQKWFSSDKRKRPDYSCFNW